MNMKNLMMSGLAAVLAATTVASAAVVRVEIHGSVEFNVFVNGPLVSPNVQAGDPVVISFNLDSNNFIDSPLPICHTRGYRFVDGSFRLRVGGVDVSMVAGLPEAQVPYFILRDNDSVADGVLFANAGAVCAQGEVAIPIDLPGASGAPFGLNFLRTFDDGNSPNTVFNSLDILENEGYWAFEWMSSYNFGIDGGAGTPLGITYEWFTITRLSEPQITQQPAPDSACPGETANFSVAAINASAYQWRQNGAPLVDGLDGNGGIISGATTAALEIQLVAPGHVGQYDCLVSNGLDTNFPYDVIASDSVALSIWNSCTGGDMNCDNTINVSDVQGFIQAIISPGDFTGCSLNNADVNGDSQINGRDVHPFVGLLVQ